MKKQILFAVLSCVMTLNSAQALIKNPQTVLGGLLTRAGVAKQQPLNNDELVALCKEGYTRAYSMYLNIRPFETSCLDGARTIRYQTLSMRAGAAAVIQDVARGLSTGEKTFVHCYNGAHASGFDAAVALKQFCGMSGEQAAQYWLDSLNGYPLEEPNQSKVLNSIRSYPVDSSLPQLTAEQRQTFGCP